MNRYVIIVISTILFTNGMPPRPGLFDQKTGLSVTYGHPYPKFPEWFGKAGEKKILLRNIEAAVILIQYPDNRANTVRDAPARYDSMFFSRNVYHGQYRAGSLNDFWHENSYDSCNVAGGIAGNTWFMCGNNYSKYYDGNYMLSTGSTLARDAIAKADSTVDFRIFDRNNDGRIDATFVVHAGPGGEDTGNRNHCWSHAIPSFSYTTNEGVRISGVTNVPEVNLVTPQLDTTLCCIAVMCHEFGHLVGLPDLYDGSRNTWGIGYWGLMGYGAWGAGGNTPWSPSHLEAWSKVQSGFVTPIVITRDTINLKIVDVETHSVIYKVWRMGRNTDTCFYLENRQKKGFDTPLPYHGLLIWHIDPRYGSTYHDRVDLEEDSTFHLDRGTGVRPDPHYYHQALGDTSDPLPGIWNRTAFDNNTIPNSRDNNGNPTRVAVRNIREQGDTVICDIYVNLNVEEENTHHTIAPSIRVKNNPTRRPVLFVTRNSSEGQNRKIEIYNAIGRKIITLNLKGFQYRWHGNDEKGRPVNPGVYFYQLKNETGQEFKGKFLLIE